MLKKLSVERMGYTLYILHLYQAGSNESVNMHIYFQLAEWMHRWMDRWIDRSMNEQMDLSSPSAHENRGELQHSGIAGILRWDETIPP